MSNKPVRIRRTNLKIRIATANWLRINPPIIPNEVDKVLGV